MKHKRTITQMQMMKSRKIMKTSTNKTMNKNQMIKKIIASLFNKTQKMLPKIQAMFPKLPIMLPTMLPKTQTI